ncbi:MAG: glycosyltransferase [Candidatus Zeuxoniibacter abyssi]|nr:MAG: glycosyltransferase [Candidatus Persebacteraceae bacterium AB1(2)]
MSRRHEVHVFTREENPFVADGVVREEHDLLSPEVKLHIVNAAQVGINYQSRRINRAFAQVAGDVKPDVAHIGHLNHLSLGIVDELATLDIPIVFTLHDFWLMCLRGQFIQIAPSEKGKFFLLAMDRIIKNVLTVVCGGLAAENPPIRMTGDNGLPGA